MGLTNMEILDIHLKSGLIKRCVDCQFARLFKTDPWKTQFRKDFMNDLVLIILNYDNEKLNDVQSKGWMNGWLTRVILNQIYSKSSEFYQTYCKGMNEKIFITLDKAKIEEDGEDEEEWEQQD